MRRLVRLSILGNLLCCDLLRMASLVRILMKYWLRQRIGWRKMREWQYRQFSKVWIYRSLVSWQESCSRVVSEELGWICKSPSWICLLIVWIEEVLDFLITFPCQMSWFTIYHRLSSWMIQLLSFRDIWLTKIMIRKISWVMLIKLNIDIWLRMNWLEI